MTVRGRGQRSALSCCEKRRKITEILTDDLVLSNGDVRDSDHSLAIQKSEMAKGVSRRISLPMGLVI